MCVGDTAILLSAGWSPLKVAIFQVISQATAFIGLYVGISVSETSSSAETWILSVAMGIFLYVALADVVSIRRSYYSIVFRGLRSLQQVINEKC
jgi:zinc transporter 4